MASKVPTIPLMSQILSGKVVDAIIDIFEIQFESCGQKLSTTGHSTRVGR